MKRYWKILAVALAALFTAPAARADTGGGNTSWSVISATTNKSGNDVISMEMGFPGFSFGYTHGLSGGADVGVKFDFLYSLFDTTATQFGMQLRVPFRFQVAQKDNVSLLLHIDPGLFVYPGSDSRESLFGLSIRPGAVLGFHATPRLQLGLGLDLPMNIQMLHGADFIIGPEVGPFVEFAVNNQISVGLNTRFGPIFVPTAGSDASLGFITEATLGWRL